MTKPHGQWERIPGNTIGRIRVDDAVEITISVAPWRCPTEAEATERVRRAEALLLAVPKMVEALLRVRGASVNERTWNEAEGRVDDMQAAVAEALRVAGVR